MHYIPNWNHATRLDEMKGRWLTLILFAILLLLQIQLWIGDGSIGQQKQLEREISVQKLRNESLEKRNEVILLEIESLGDTVENDEGLEERARSKLGMVEDGEVFIMMIEENSDVEQVENGQGEQ